MPIYWAFSGYSVRKKKTENFKDFFFLNSKLFKNIPSGIFVDFLRYSFEDHRKNKREFFKIVFARIKRTFQGYFLKVNGFKD